MPNLAAQNCTGLFGTVFFRVSVIFRPGFFIPIWLL